jgi:hypothetical protein
MSPDVLSEPQPASRALPTVYFPIAVEGGVVPSRPLPAGGALVQACPEVDVERDLYLAGKRLLRADPRRAPQRLAQADAAVGCAEAQLRMRMAELPCFRANAARLAQLDLDALVSELQEDLVIMQLPAGYAPERVRASYLHVSFPSGWDPGQMLGKSFPALHARVPREPGFDKADQPAHAASLFMPPAERFVWSLTPDAVLDRHPLTPRSASWQDTSQAFLRVERQVHVPLEAPPEHGQLALFFIRIFVYPLARLDEQQLATLVEAVQRMPEAVRRYKGLFGNEARILALLMAAQQSAARLQPASDQ